MSAPSRREQTILGTGLLVCGAFMVLSSTVPDAVGLALGVSAIAVLTNRPSQRDDASSDGTRERQKR